MLVKRTHGDLAMEFQVGWQNYGKCRARNNRRNCVLHIDAVKHVNGLLWIRGRRWERVCRAELIALSNVGGRIDALGTRAHLNGYGGRCGAMHSMGHILPDQIANRRGWGGCRLACRPTLRGVLHTHPRCSDLVWENVTHAVHGATTNQR